eukprot:12599744-Alexandrium_andersonii.AAC.1
MEGAATLAAAYRALASRAILLSLDRSDLGFAAKECCRRMSAPTTADWSVLLRLARYLALQPRAVDSSPWQDEGVAIRTFVDTDFA